MWCWGRDGEAWWGWSGGGWLKGERMGGELEVVWVRGDEGGGGELRS